VDGQVELMRELPSEPEELKGPVLEKDGKPFITLKAAMFLVDDVLHHKLLIEFPNGPPPDNKDILQFYFNEKLASG